GDQGFLRINLNDTDYEDNTDDTGMQRGSDGYEMVAGVRLDLSGVTYGDIFAGYISHDFIDSSLVTIDGVTFGADLTWNASELTTVMLKLTREISETTQSSTSGTFDTEFDVSIDHELLRHLTLSATAGFEHQEFEGTTREDRYLRFGFGARYLVNRNLDILFNYDFDRRTSDHAGSDYTENLFMLRAIGKL
ncbi:MAG: outer membrane beta-barrel protein, partial [Pseudomonadota bacterium]|nr:outer membrane beta-barrel protein [Pseudomonadota bacterium]